MSIESVAKVLHINDRRLDPTTKLILIGIANHDGDGGAWPSIATLGTYAMVSRSTVKRHLRLLEDIGYITTHKNAGGFAKRADRRPNLYELHLEPQVRREVTADPPLLDGGSNDAPRGFTGEPHGGSPVNPEPSLNHPGRTARISGEEKSSSTADSRDAPEDDGESNPHGRPDPSDRQAYEEWAWRRVSEQFTGPAPGEPF